MIHSLVAKNLDMKKVNGTQNSQPYLGVLSGYSEELQFFIKV